MLFEQLTSGNNYLYLIIWYVLIDETLFETSFEYFVYIISFMFASLVLATNSILTNYIAKVVDS
jgi:flagellar biosynthesis regulator FlbT